MAGLPSPSGRGCALPPSLFASIPSTRGTSHRFQELIRRRSPGHPRGVSRTPRGSYLGRDCRQAEEDRGRAGWRGGAAAYEAQGFRVGVPAGAALVRATVPSGDFGAAPASKRGGEGPGRPSRAQSLLPLPPVLLSGAAPWPGDSSERGAPLMGRGLDPPRAGSVEGALGRDTGRPPRPAPPLALPAASIRPFRAGPARSQPGRASAAAPPASGARAPARRRGSGCPAGPGTECGGGGAKAGRGTPSPRACAARLRLRAKEALERASTPAWGAGPGAQGRGRRPGKVTRAEAGRSAVGAGNQGGWPRCRRERSPASAAAASETHRLPRAPSTQSWAAAEAAAGSRAPLAGAGARSPPPARGRAGAAGRGPPGGGKAGEALESGLGAGPAAACPERWARSAAAVTVCLCHVCAAGGDREPGPGSGRGRGQHSPRRPPPPRDGAAGQCSSARPQAGGSNTRSQDLGLGRDERVQAGSSPPFSPQPPPPRPLLAASGLASLAEGGGRKAGWVCSSCCRLLQARQAVQPVHSPLYKTAVVGSRKFPRLHFYSGRRFSQSKKPSR
ncbi:spidroin-2-like [Phacochoerus africanus]|uniref:spidroin-2-like n=1 Tax=Phacochoerus africanus TaxID=41426 RepID=UPI001FDA6575|nr:spidroin-2-like [Phacochoerus africanus]